MKKAIKYSKLLQEVGLSKEQAETHLEILEEIVDVDLATKTDIFKLETKIDGLEKNLINFKSEVALKFTSLEQRLVYKLSLIMATGLAIMTALSKLVL